MLSQTAPDVLTECEYERVRAELHRALHGSGNPSQGERSWLAGRREPKWHSEADDAPDMQHRHQTVARLRHA
ncbi:hypothetical protein CXP34_01405 [Ralstonia mannitolilytica]|nr:hypothetical protein CXP34_01405 [Ralstonia mannitolilytica]